MKNIKTLIKITFVALVVLRLLIVSVSATPYKGYNYNSWDEPVPSQIGFLPEKVLGGNQFGEEVGLLLNPQDLFVTEKSVFILDSGNNRIIELDTEFNYVGIIQNFHFNDQEVKLNEPTGLFVKNDILYIADPKNSRVVVSGKDGNIKMFLEKPETNMLDKEFLFQPTKVLVDSSDIIYVTVSGLEKGAVLYTAEGEFSGFFGSNTVEVTAKLLLDQLWKKILPQSATEAISRYIPEEIASFCIDERDFIYTVTQTSTSKQKVKKLNSTGKNILVAEEFGELEQEYVAGQLMTSRFIDIAVDDNGNIAVLDSQSNRVYQYDKEGTFLFVFGGTGTQNGTFSAVSAVETLGEYILVLDSKKHNLTVFAPTQFGKNVHKAVNIYNQGQYSDASALWEEILITDQNYLTGYISIGKSLLANKEYKQAAEYFKAGNDREGNSDAFQAYRNQIIQKFFPLICLVIVALGVWFIWRFNRKNKAKDSKNSKYINPFRFLFHPTDSAEEMKYYKSGSVWYSILILLLWFFAVVFDFSLKGFRFNTNNPDELNIFLLFLQTIPLFTVWVFSNWGVSTLMDGKGKLKEIFVSNSYCMIPYITAIYVNILLSWVLALNEQIFMTWIFIVGIGWSIAMLFGVLMGIHEYSVSKTIASVLLSLLGVCIVAFLVLMIVSMVQQAYGFIYSMVNELLYRLK